MLWRASKVFLGEVAERLGDAGDAFIISAGLLHH
jgi:hypothetical protein